MAKRDPLGTIESRYSLIQSVWALPVIGGGLTTALAVVTQFMQAWAPLSYGVAFMVGALLFQGWKLLRSWQAERDERRRRVQALQAPKSSLNPLDKKFDGIRIFLADLVPPFGKIISNKEFHNCELYGPLVITFQGNQDGGITFMGNSFNEVDVIAVDYGAPASNAVSMMDCAFYNCTFDRVTILVSAIDVEPFERGFKGGLKILNREMFNVLRSTFPPPPQGGIVTRKQP